MVGGELQGSQGNRYYPVSLNVHGRKCLVVGGGKVALRKIKSLLEHGAKVEAISPEFCQELKELAKNGKMKDTQRGYAPGDITGVFLVIAATNENDINNSVADEAHRQNILINVVDDPSRSNFILPSYLSRGDITISVSTNSASPALARKIRTKLEQNFGDEYTDLAALIKEIRSEFKDKSSVISAGEWQEALDLEQLLGLLRSDKRREAASVLRSKLMAHIDPKV